MASIRFRSLLSFLLSFLILLSFCIFSCASASSKNYYKIPLQPVLGPESIAFDCNGQGPYVGVSDGRILRWEGNRWREFAFTAQNRQRNICDGSNTTDFEHVCGRPLGIKFNPTTCDLYIADAYLGLMVVGSNGGQAKQLAVSAEGVPFRFLNALDIDSTTGIVYFTDSSTVFQRRHVQLLTFGGDKTGRLLKYDPHSKNVTVMHRGLQFPNGVTLSKDNSFLLVAESNTKRILKFSLRGTTYIPRVITQLSRFPDNIELTRGGGFWIALNIPRKMTGPYVNDPVGVKIDEHGKIVKVLYANFASISEIEEHAGKYYMGSPENSYLGVMDM